MSSIRDKLRRLHRPRPTEAPRPADRAGAVGDDATGSDAGDDPSRAAHGADLASSSTRPPPAAEPARPAGPETPVRGDRGRAASLRSRLARFDGLADPGEARAPRTADEALFGDDPIVDDGLEAEPPSRDDRRGPARAPGRPMSPSRDEHGPPADSRPRTASRPRAESRPRTESRTESRAEPQTPHDRPARGRRRDGRLAPELFSRKRFEAWRERRVEGTLTMVPADAEARRADAPPPTGPMPSDRAHHDRAEAPPTPRSPVPSTALVPVETRSIDVPAAACTHLSEVTRGRFHRAAGGGTCWVARDRVPLASRYGDVALADALAVDAEHVVRASGDLSLGRFDVRDAVFFDLETSGLSAAKGAVAWIVGFAWIHGDDVVVEQIALHDPAEERATLDAALARIRAAGTLVSFNGASFDARFLRHRLRHHGMPDAPLDRPHLDLLPTARRVWTEGVTNHRLATLDAEILGRPRGHDIPGSEAPRRWSNYLRDGDVRPLVPLFEHNRLDLVGLVALLVAACTGRPPVTHEAASPRVTSAPPPPGRPAAAAWATAQLRLAEGDDTSAEPALREALAAGLGGGDRRRALADLAALRERAGDAIDAVHFWQQLVDDGAPDATPHIQLARIWRDGLDRPDRALDHLRRAAALAPWDERLSARVIRVEREVERRGRN